MTARRATVSTTAPRNPVVERRLGRLVAAGFAPRLAADLAGDCRIDLHALLALTDRGCRPELAARILAPLDARPRPC
jgi:hypothetical protein